MKQLQSIWKAEAMQVHLRQNKEYICQMQKGWIKIEKDEYFLSESSGRMKTGWTHWKKKWYYLESNGKLAKNTERYLMGHTFHFNKTGEWVKD